MVCMLSLYIHIPFCAKKCWYCSFPVIPLGKHHDPQSFAYIYSMTLKKDITDRWDSLMHQWKKQPIYTIYIWWWTPLLFGAEYIEDILSCVYGTFDCSAIQEITIECNPYPYEQTLQALEKIIQGYKHIPRIRFSFGIQSLDDTILQQANRDNTFAWVRAFTQALIEKKHQRINQGVHIIYNYDIISFWVMQQQQARDRFDELLATHSIDSYSLYTLELFAWAKRYHESISHDATVSYQAPRDHHIPFVTDQEKLFDEFTLRKKRLQNAWYGRYEISNYALPGKECLHNQVYRSMGAYLGVWLWAHSFLHSSDALYGKRGEYPLWWKQYTQRIWQTSYPTWTALTQSDYQIESFFLWLRQKKGISDCAFYEHLLVPQRHSLCKTLHDTWLIVYENNTLSLTDAGMDVHHRICTTLLQEI